MSIIDKKEQIQKLLNAHSDLDRAQQKSKYMRNLFPFYGITKKELYPLIKPILKESQAWDIEDIILLCFNLFREEKRECHYVAIYLFTKNYARCTYEHIYEFSRLIDKKSWWDSVDLLQKPFSLWTKQNQEYLPKILREWNSEASIWKKRSAIILQLLWKKDLHADLLEEVILANIGNSEFFIQKAIGWALRDYSKTNPQWVAQFIKTHPLSPLSVREGSKYIPK